MIEELGMKKVVWVDAGRTKVIHGETEIDGLFVKVTPVGKGTFWINKEAIVFIS